ELLDENGNLFTDEYDETVWEDELDENNNRLYIYSLRYEEFIALNTAVIQKQQHQIEDLEKRLEKIEKSR
ncbi:MAG: hypothetical protein K2K19_02800, partial [Acetatifactor sp.]|nr:hypothetical protein [Acetatifactor sp.]